ncbi:MULTISPECIES: zinc ribbon domain-containing protein [Hafniaceae]|uniref:Putative zinc-ribbon domain-containing protein n=1 Tax=Obesumbacterium proteus ATCC 12841 TaxID=1354268 RepID=A0AA91ED41_9GAMM|nr:MULTISPECIES: zinc ribbon domain-containing protein [Hafniaceae]AMO83116.1 hypothetical protein DSM2777_19960 [Obesumbacterium proteus]OAT58454.1 hypothetical protein M993_02824 [Obesumbacterium proteus ATCC 12841]
MRILGFIVIGIGLVWAVAALLMDVSVVVNGGYRVNNIGLLATKQNNIIIGGFITLCGLLVAIFGERLKLSYSRIKCPKCAELVSAEAIKCKHCGSDLVPIKPNEPDTQGEVKNSRLDGVNMKYPIILVLVVFAAIITSIVLYRN